MEFQQLETARQAYAKRVRAMIAIAIIAVVGTVVMACIGVMSLYSGLTKGILSIMGIGIAIALIALVVIFLASRKEAKLYKNLYKSFFVETSLNQIFTDVLYDHAAGIPKAELEQTGMINTGDVYSSNDLFSGKYHDVSIKQADVLIQEKHTDSDGNTTYTTIFKGRWMVFGFPKKFSFRLQIVDRHFAARKRARRNPVTNRKFEKYSTESITFDKQFKIFAEDGFETYYILDPSLINQIEKLNNSHEGRILLCFIDNKLSVAIDDRNDAFEAPSPLKPIDVTKEQAKINQDIKTITDFVDYLKLDRKLFKKDQGAK